MAKPVQRKPTTRTRRGGLTRRDLAMLPVVIGAMASGRAEAQTSLAVENASLADVDRISDLMGANLLSFRVGYNYRFGKPGRGVAFWLGTSGQVIGLDTSGSVKLADVLPPPSQDQVDKVNARCDELRPNDPRKPVCTDFANKLQGWVNGTDPAASVAYSLQKKPTDTWNMLAGAQFALDRGDDHRVHGRRHTGRIGIGGERELDVTLAVGMPRPRFHAGE